MLGWSLPARLQGLRKCPVRIGTYRQLAEAAARQLDSDPKAKAIVHQLRVLAQDSERGS